MTKTERPSAAVHPSVQRPPTPPATTVAGVAPAAASPRAVEQTEIHVAYVMWHFPLLSETFIQREILALRRNRHQQVTHSRRSKRFWQTWYPQLFHTNDFLTCHFEFSAEQSDRPILTVCSITRPCGDTPLCANDTKSSHFDDGCCEFRPASVRARST